jgi:uncharacterized Ntn-hydrolase superfamily protein
MTWSIIAHDKKTGQLGIGAASGAHSVGVLVPHINSRVGAIAVQGEVAAGYGANGMLLLDRGLSPREMLETLVASDERRSERQVHAVDVKGQKSSFTGSACAGWAGHLADEGVSIAGNFLSSRKVLTETLRLFKSSSGTLAQRLLAAMEAGEAAGGDKRGRKSAVITVSDAGSSPPLNLSIDSHANPLRYLRSMMPDERQQRLQIHLQQLIMGSQGGGETISIPRAAR